MKCFFRKLILCAMALTVLCVASAGAEWKELYDDQFAQQFQLNSLKERMLSSSVEMDNKLYSLMGDGTIYSCDLATWQFEIISQVAVFPDVDMEKPYRTLDEETKKAIANAVTRLIPSTDDSHILYGFNQMTGALSRIDEDGVYFQETRMDPSVFFYDKSDYPERLFKAIEIKDGYLEGYTVLDPDAYTCITWLSFSLTDGTCTKTDLPGAFQVCRWKDNRLLAAVLRDGKTELVIYDKEGNEVNTLGIALPDEDQIKGTSYYDLTESAGPLAYDDNSGAIYYLDNQHLWRSNGTEAFEPVDGPAGNMLIDTLNMIISSDGNTIVYGMKSRTDFQ